MCLENFVIEAAERVLGWGLSHEALSQAVRDQAALMAGFGADHVHEFSNDCMTFAS